MSRRQNAPGVVKGNLPLQKAKDALKDVRDRRFHSEGMPFLLSSQHAAPHQTT